MRVHYFWAESALDLAKLIRDWLDENPNIEIEFITQSQTGDRLKGTLSILIIIWYQELEPGTAGRESYN